MVWYNIVPVQGMGSNRSNKVSSTTDFLRYSLLSKDVEECLVYLRIRDNWLMFHDAMLLILHGYPYPLPATDENIPSSATIPRYSIDAYMNCVDACYQTLKHKMNGRCGPASNFVDTTRTQIPLCRSDIDVCFQAEDTFVLCLFLFHNLFNRFNSGFTCWFISWAEISHDSSCESGKLYFAKSTPTVQKHISQSLCHRFLLDKAHISLEVYKRPLLSITDYNVFHTGPGMPTEDCS